MNRKLQKSGFSLIELSIVITIMSIATLGFISFGIAPMNDDAAKINQTYDKMIEIDKAIKNYFAIYNRLPCPAQNTASMGSINSQTYNSTSYNFPFDNEYIAYTTTNGNECLSPIGTIPTKNLGLSSSYMLDAWGRKFNYHVHQNLCGNNSLTIKNCTASSYKNNTPVIQILSSSTGSTLVTNAAYVLVSYGPNAYGAYSTSGSYTGASPNTYEIANDASKAVASLNFNNYYKGPAISIFDDIVIYGTKNQLSAAKHLPSNSALSLTACAANSYALNNSSYAGLLPTVRSTITVTQNNNNGTMYNYGDEAFLEMMWVLQDACYEIYGNNGSLTKSCANSATNYTTTNSCCPFGLTYNNTTNSCL